MKKQICNIKRIYYFGIMLGDVLTRTPQFSKEFKTLINWVDKKRKLLIRTNADSPVGAHILSGAVFEPGSMHNKGNYIVSLGNVCRWLAGQAEALEAEIFPGFPAVDIIINDNNINTIWLTPEGGGGPNYPNM